MLTIGVDQREERLWCDDPVGDYHWSLFEFIVAAKSEDRQYWADPDIDVDYYWSPLQLEIDRSDYTELIKRFEWYYTLRPMELVGLVELIEFVPKKSYTMAPSDAQ